MKTLAIACTCLLLFAATASADDVTVSKAILDSMGLGTMQVLPDRDGMAVRGKFTSAGVWGGSIATWGGQTSSNNYFAGSSWLGSQGSSALGSSLSFGGTFQFNHSPF
ncbi:MAG: hypothetical protein WD063_09375 [Pirellulales bacterium]